MEVCVSLMEQPRAGSWLMWSAFYNTWDFMIFSPVVSETRVKSMEEHMREVLWANSKLAHISHHLTFPGLGISHMALPTCEYDWETQSICIPRKQRIWIWVKVADLPQGCLLLPLHCVFS